MIQDKINSSTTKHLYNFAGGVGLLPPKVIKESQEAIIEVPNTGISALVIDHRSQLCRDILDEAETNIRTLLNIPRNYQVLFLQGGASLQFAMIPMNCCPNKSQITNYIVSGYWSQKSSKEAQKLRKTHIIWDGTSENYQRTPKPNEYQIDADAAYFHYCSNETVEGLRFSHPVNTGNVPLICDMSSDFLTKPVEITKYGLIYAHAQKNIGAAGVTVVIIRDDLVENISDEIPAILDYRSHIKMKSIYNTPPIFAIYVVLLVTRWLLNDVGGLKNMAQLNQRKASVLYNVLDQSQGFYQGHAEQDSRSLINVVFNLPTPELEIQLLQAAQKVGIIGLKGHRSLGGLRASLYNPMPLDGVLYLRDFLEKFQTKYS